MVNKIHACNCNCYLKTKNVKTSKDGNIVQIKNGDDEYILCEPAKTGRKFIPTLHNGKSIHITKEDAITLLINAAAQRTYENL